MGDNEPIGPYRKEQIKAWLMLLGSTKESHHLLINTELSKSQVKSLSRNLESSIQGFLH